LGSYLRYMAGTSRRTTDRIGASVSASPHQDTFQPVGTHRIAPPAHPSRSPPGTSSASDGLPAASLWSTARSTWRIRWTPPQRPRRSPPAASPAASACGTCRSNRGCSCTPASTRSSRSTPPRDGPNAGRLGDPRAPHRPGYDSARRTHRGHRGRRRPGPCYRGERTGRPLRARHHPDEEHRHTPRRPGHRQPRRGWPTSTPGGERLAASAVTGR
jgi:hypothetical protein